MSEPRKTALYRFFDADGRLLYVGVTSNPKVRWHAHELYQHWWQEVHTKEIEWLPTRAEALAAERQAIRTEKPLHDKSDRQAARARVPEPERRAQSEEYTAKAVQALEADIRAGVFPSGTVLPTRSLLAARYSLPTTAISSALWDLRRPRRLVTQARNHWVVQDPETFPSALANRHGVLYALGIQAFGQNSFTREDVQRRTRLAPGVVRQGLGELRRAGMAVRSGKCWNGVGDLWRLLPAPPLTGLRESVEPEIGL